MDAYGSDRLTRKEDGLIELFAKALKPGWEGRRQASNAREHPGSAVLWDGDVYEVLQVLQLAHEVRYTLAAWQDNHTMRTVFRYDVESERLHAAECNNSKRRDALRRLATLGGIATGHLPSRVQQHLAHELGTNAPMLTMMSACAEIGLAIFILGTAVDAKYTGTGGPPLWTLMLAFFFAFDGPTRLGFAFLRAEPIGSLLGLAGYVLFFCIRRDRGRLPRPFATNHNSSATPTLTPEEMITIWEPILTLLSAADQRRLAERYNFDYRRYAKQTAGTVLTFALLGIMTTAAVVNRARPSMVVAFTIAVVLALEQLGRLGRLGSRPAGSLLQFVLRPFVKTLL